MVKHFSKQQVDDLIKLKFGRLVSSADNVQYVSNEMLGKIFGVSASKIRELYAARFRSIADKQLPFLQQLQLRSSRSPRQRYGLRFLEPFHINWLVNARTLRQ